MNIVASKISYHSPSFGTTIRIVSPKNLSYIISNNLSATNTAYIHHLETHLKNKNLCGIRTNVLNCLTDGIATCTAGIITNTKEKIASLFFHLIPNNTNFNYYSEFESKIPSKNHSNAIIVGSKGGSKNPWIIEEQPRTGEFFHKIKTSIKQHKIPLSVIGNMQDEFSTSILYIANDDVLYLSIHPISGNNYVHNMQELKSVCREISLSKKDKLEFYDDILDIKTKKF